MKVPIYLDNHATTRVDSRVLDRMYPYFGEKFGNAASRNHAFGWESEAAVEKAREEIAQLIHAESGREIIFTSGATESNNLAIKGVAEAYRAKGNHIVTCVTEHKAVLDSCRALEGRGFRVTYLPVDRSGIVDCRRLRDSLTDQTVLISIMTANNEIGTLQPLDEIGLIAAERGILFHTDAAQAAGKVPIDLRRVRADLLSLSAHKMYGPKGIGALYIREKKPAIALTSIIDGGGHERGMRSGTLNVPGIVGSGAACAIAGKEMAVEAERLLALREQLKDGILSGLDGVYVNGDLARRLPGNLNLSFAGVEGESLLMSLGDIAVSSGSACASSVLEPSYVLRAIGVKEELAQSSIRFGLGRFNTAEEIGYTVDRVIQEVRRLRARSPSSRARKSRVEERRVPGPRAAQPGESERGSLWPRE